MKKLLSNTTGEYIPGISVGHAAISSQTTIHTDKNDTGMIPLNTINLNQYSQMNSLSRSQHQSAEHYTSPNFPGYL